MNIFRAHVKEKSPASQKSKTGILVSLPANSPTVVHALGLSPPPFDVNLSSLFTLLLHLHNLQPISSYPPLISFLTPISQQYHTCDMLVSCSSRAY